MEQINDIQGFIETYYPDYDHANEIAWEGDLFKLVNEEYEEGDCAHDLLQEKYNGDIDDPRIEIDWQESRIDILERSIKGYIESQKNKEE